jgi:MFS family permease
VFGGCLALMFAGAVLLATLKPGFVTVALYLFGLGWGGNYTMLQGLVADVFGARSLGKILGGITVLDATGGALGPWITGALFDLSNSYRLGFTVIAVLIGVSLAAILSVRLPERAAH